MSDLEASRPHLRAAYLRRPAADAEGPALLRRRLHGGRRPVRRGAPRDRGAGRRRGTRRDAGAHADRGQPDAVGHVARRRPGAHRQERGAAEAYRVHPARADQGAGRAGRRRTATSKTASSTCRPASPSRSCTRRRTSSTRISAAGRWPRRRAEIDTAARKRPRAALDTLSQDLVERAWRSGPAATSGLPAQLIVRGRANLLENVTAPGRHRAAAAPVRRPGDEGRADPAARPRRGAARACASSSARRTSCSRCPARRWSWRPTATRMHASSAPLGVIGPTRLNYARIVPMVDYTAQLISRMLR